MSPRQEKHEEQKLHTVLLENTQKLDAKNARKDWLEALPYGYCENDLAARREDLRAFMEWW